MGGATIVNITAHLRALAQSRPQTLALIEPHGRSGASRVRYRHLTYRELDAESDVLAHGLDQVGIRRGVRTVLMVPPSLEFYALAFALLKAGAVVILIDPGMGARNLGVCLREAAPQAFIGTPKAHLARVLLGWGRETVRSSVTVGVRLGWGGDTLTRVRRLGAAAPGAYVLADTRAGETCAILFTSGSTGAAKGVSYSHDIFAAQVEALRRLYGIEPGEVDLPTFPLFGLFGPALGLTSVIPEMDATRPADVDPNTIVDAVRHFGITNLFGSPALIRRVGRHGAALGVKLPTLRRVISAGAPVSARAIETFAAMLADGVEVHTPYGATEALPVCSIGSDEILKETRFRTAEGAGVCVGRPADGMAVRIIPISDEPIATWDAALELPRGQVGEIAVQGPVVTCGYHARPESTALAKIADDSGGFWHRMGDLGYLDERGRLWFCGRKSQRVETASGALFTVACEGVFNAHPSVYRTALVGVPGRTELKSVPPLEPVLCVERDADSSPLSDDQLRRELLDLGAARPQTRGIRRILFHKSFPVDVRHNAKIFREKLAVWAAGQVR
jgi:acyl-CoA synthetase (AMP-forming)/AMP-acid ligase II